MHQETRGVMATVEDRKHECWDDPVCGSVLHADQAMRTP